MSRMLFTVFLAGILLIFPVIVFACHCWELNPPLVEADWADAVFTGTVLEVEAASDPNYLVALVWITAFWKGVELGTVQIYTYYDPAGCGFTFQLFEEYLFYAKNGLTCCGLGVALCTRTRSVSTAQEDFNALGPPVGTTPVDFQTWGAVKKLYE